MLCTTAYIAVFTCSQERCASCLHTIGKYISLPVFLSDQIEQIKQWSVKIICPALSYKDGLKELNLSTVLTSIVGSSCVKDFMITTLVLQVIFLSHLLPTKYLHSYNFKAGNILLCKRPSSRFVTLSFPLVYENGIFPGITNLTV